MKILINHGFQTSRQRKTCNLNSPSAVKPHNDKVNKAGVGSFGNKTRLCRQRCLQATQLVGLNRAETDQFTPLQLSLQPFGLVMNLWCKLDFKERKKIKRQLKKKTGERVELLLEESHATASLISKCRIPQLLSLI